MFTLDGGQTLLFFFFASLNFYWKLKIFDKHLATVDSDVLSLGIFVVELFNGFFCLFV